MTETDRKRQATRGASVRGSDLEPYTALRWLGTLFKVAAIFLFVALVSEFIAGLRFEGVAALPTLLGELARTLVLAVVLWGAGDLVKLLIHVGHDIRAQRILAGRMAARTGDDLPGGNGGTGDTLAEGDVARGTVAGPAGATSATAATAHADTADTDAAADATLPHARRRAGDRSAAPPPVPRAGQA
jgi:hypothetical protein